jgi:hypothetical protein
VLLQPRLFPGFISSGKSVSLEMLRAGWATTYEQANAEYGPWGKEMFLQLEQEAKWVDHLLLSCYQLILIMYTETISAAFGSSGRK